MLFLFTHVLFNGGAKINQAATTRGVFLQQQDDMKTIGRFKHFGNTLLSHFKQHMKHLWQLILGQRPQQTTLLCFWCD